jgi:hypothetical protein
MLKDAVVGTHLPQQGQHFAGTGEKEAVDDACACTHFPYNLKMHQQYQAQEGNLAMMF